MDDRPNRRPIPSERDRAFLSAAASGEVVVDHVEGLEATLIVTGSQVIVVRQGAYFRPRSGIRSWPLLSIRDVQLAPPRNGSGRIVLRTGPYPWQAVSLFVGGRELSDAERVVGQIRNLSAQARRARDDASKRPSSGSDSTGLANGIHRMTTDTRPD